MTRVSAPTSATPVDLTYFVEGMDCPTCVRKIEGALANTPGAQNARTSLTTQTLTLTLDETKTTRAHLEKILHSLGHTPKPLNHDDAEPHEHEATSWHATRQGRLVLTSGALLVLAFTFSLIEPALATWGYIAATALGTLPLARKAWAGVRVGQPWTINTLVTLAAIGALVIGEAAEAAVVVFFFALGELLEGVAVGRARSGIKALAQLAPKTARVLKKGKVFELPVDALKVGNLVEVRPGDRVPSDGIITEGASHLDDSPVTGESVPVHKRVGDSVYAGSINTDGVLTVRVEKAAKDNTIARIIHLVEQAEANKAPVARFIDRFSRVYTPIVVLIAALTALVPPLLGGQWHDWAYKSIALLLIGCPCALVLSVPAAITSAVSAGAKRGLLLKGGAALEMIGRVKTVAFDKTGTLTEGQPKVTDVTPLTGTEASVLRLAASVEAGSNHPLANAIVTRAFGLDVPLARNANAIPGKAVAATIDGATYAVGSPRYAEEHALLAPDVRARVSALEERGKTVVVLLREHEPLGLIALRDEPRSDAKATVSALRRLGVRPVMLTGDNVRTGAAIASELGLDVQAELLPEDKLRLVEHLKRDGRVAMVGDGINDAPALAASDVGIAMGGGTDVALETAHAALLRPSVQGIAELVRLSRATRGIITQNIVFAVGLKLVFLVTTLLGITGLWPAILSDTGATALVTANALRLLAFKGNSE
ncbi:heavy metal translocating P-type ATPase [Deinococcus yavapaiensis]|uniref:Cd2+/Zn2+-exporting ATPase n=1 Tax=Deinococcus yavapaiensis KR-236 TaxID=694435 RepID=A0A318SAC9_9DEIO|nr:heavy metal translocating P-type ATPase [Deinococcus yavapaiensis]PYE53184.1 Cd2+/Zn2+-exporting ATPase [Deinococcus yavapaiensis KR-236]